MGLILSWWIVAPRSEMWEWELPDRDMTYGKGKSSVRKELRLSFVALAFRASGLQSFEVEELKGTKSPLYSNASDCLG